MATVIDMATVIELKRGEQPRQNERYALVLVSERPPREGPVISLNGVGRVFHAYDNLRDISAVVGRAVTWADENIVARVYMRKNLDDTVLV